jgi:CDP-4-dehydro-6-deoxyglucose reductase
VSEVQRFEFIKPQVPRPAEVSARVVFKEWLTPDTLKIGFEPVGASLFPFVPGQYVSLVLEADPARDLRRELRPYSLWGHPDEFEYAITVVRMVEGGRATSWLRDIEIGTDLKMVGPLGSFFLRRPLHKSIVFVATGTGVVPLRSMLKDLIATGEIHNHDTQLLFGVRHQRDLFELQEMSRWAERFERFQFVPTLSRPDESWDGATGRVTEHLERMDLPIEDVQVYLCGNGAMIQDAVALLEARGLNRRTRRVVLEKYFD